MMSQNGFQMVVVLRDDKSGGYFEPRVGGSLPEVMRGFMASVQMAPQTQLAMFPADFSVWHIADWNPASGQLDVLIDKEFLFNVADLLNQHAPKKGESVNGSQAQ